MYNVYILILNNKYIYIYHHISFLSLSIGKQGEFKRKNIGKIAQAFVKAWLESRRSDKKKDAAFVARKPLNCTWFGRHTMQVPGLGDISNLRSVDEYENNLLQIARKCKSQETCPQPSPGPLQQALKRSVLLSPCPPNQRLPVAESPASRS